MTYSFDIDVAKEYGVNEAIMIQNFQFWIMKNKANKKNFFDGHYWTYSSKKAFMELFGFWSEQSIKTILNHLKERGVLITANYNNSPYDRTLWYAFADEKKWLGENELLEKLEATNGKFENNQPIPDINTDINTDIKEKYKKESLALPPSRSNMTAIHSQFQDWWNNVLIPRSNTLDSESNIARFAVFSEQRKRAFNQRWKETKNLVAKQGIKSDDEVFEYLTKKVIGYNYINSRFLRGLVKSDKYPDAFLFTVDYVLRPSTWTKLLENGFLDRNFLQTS